MRICALLSTIVLSVCLIACGTPLPARTATSTPVRATLAASPTATTPPETISRTTAGRPGSPPPAPLMTPDLEATFRQPMSGTVGDFPGICLVDLPTPDFSGDFGIYRDQRGELTLVLSILPLAGQPLMSAAEGLNPALPGQHDPGLVPLGSTILARVARPNYVRIDYSIGEQPGSHVSDILIPAPVTGFACFLRATYRGNTTSDDDAILDGIATTLRSGPTFVPQAPGWVFDASERCGITLPARYALRTAGGEGWLDSLGGTVVLMPQSLNGRSIASALDSLGRELFSSASSPTIIGGTPERRRADYTIARAIAGTPAEHPTRGIIAGIRRDPTTACALVVSYNTAQAAIYEPLIAEMIASLAAERP